MDSQVVVVNNGRSGWIVYIEGGKQLRFWWELLTDGAAIHASSPADWDEFCDKNNADWAKRRRLEILQRIADEVVRQEAPRAKVTITDSYGIRLVF